MGAFSVKIEIGPMDGARYAEVDALAGTGANTTMMPASILRGLGIEPTMSQMFERADGNRVELDMGNASVKIEGRETVTWVIFGEDETVFLLGAYTLTGVFMKADPVNRRLEPIPYLTI